MRRRAISSVGVAAVFSVAVALATWEALGASVGVGRGPALVALGVFTLTMFAWSRLRSRENARA